jgi:hypothetical protein
MIRNQFIHVLIVARQWRNTLHLGHIVIVMLLKADTGNQLDIDFFL